MYVIVYSLQTGVIMPDLYRHLMNVTVRCCDAPIVLVGTHSDAIGGDPSLPLESLKKEFPQVHDWRTWFRPCSVLQVAHHSGLRHLSHD